MQLQRPVLVQEQRLKLSPQLLMSLKVMELPVMELREKIQDEIEKNPALELLADKTTVSLDESILPKKEEDDYFEVTSDSGFVKKGGEAAAEERHRFIEGALSRDETLQDSLLWQLKLEPLEPDVRRAGELLIQNLNDDGFHIVPVDELIGEADRAPAEKAIKIIQALEPAGACTSGYRESLEVQIRLKYSDDPKMDLMLTALDYLQLLERGKMAEAAKKLGCTAGEVSEIFNKIRELNPFPGRAFASDSVRYVIPDIQVEKREGEFVIILNDVEIPVLGINPFFMKMSVKQEEKPVRDFARENIREARWFIDAINQRNHTLLRVSRAIVEFQRSFFTYGPKYLAPLTLRDIAGELGIHETTVSRTANGKYIQTEWGIFELRHFFTNSIKGIGSGGSRYSKGGVKEMIRELISTEERNFSDQDITKILSMRGVNLARRTVAKYRRELDLDSSYNR
ncbi:MAG: RNA polymerase factor sigma-54 [Treponema sp.]|nr:RNA polymerase factor sigma-54 [Treponema sp.]